MLVPEAYSAILDTYCSPAPSLVRMGGVRTSAPSTNQGASTKHKPKEPPARTGEPTHLISPLHERSHDDTLSHPACSHTQTKTDETHDGNKYDNGSQQAQTPCSNTSDQQQHM